MGLIVPCCEISEIKGEESLRSVLFSLGITNITEIEFRRELKESTRDDVIQTSDFFEYMKPHWSLHEPTKRLQIAIFEKYFQAFSCREVNIYELSLLLLPFFNISLDERRKTLIETLKALTFPKFMYRKIRELVQLYFNFHTIFLTKTIYLEYKFEHRVKESGDLWNLLLTVFNEDQVLTEVGNLFNDFEIDKAYLSLEEIEDLAYRIPINFSDLRNGFINKYQSH